MRLSTRGRYGLHAMYVLGKNYGLDPIPLSEISKMTGLSNSYLEQLIRRLKKNGLVSSVRGSQGGYFLTRNPKDISIGEILIALEDFFGTTECSTDEGYCSKQGYCPARGVWIEISKELITKANSMNLAEMVAGKYMR
ncbi:RrF2 family transcriptional regulator [Miniphocaeibacter halophilus]|uniref:Rrf2 family transcriptional regulator n=1 Tax=Miniphocaeibacter halophilus TaxID=2931922 RepID=A0AC61MPV3_9FIRM|nr:Rrf2 family transcriptional regulator [Miniphocaeibacter halophilus]QQK07585.1 Rrf2 family transcriptional regulator [Miniphocaeibacter halophilus]